MRYYMFMRYHAAYDVSPECACHERTLVGVGREEECVDGSNQGLPLIYLESHSSSKKNLQSVPVMSAHS